MSGLAQSQGATAVSGVVPALAHAVEVRQIGPVTMILGDALEVLPDLRGCADLICSDVPYELTKGGKGKPGDGSMQGKFSAETYENDGNLFADMVHWREMGGPMYRAGKPRAQAYIMANARNLSAAQEGFLGAGWRFHNLLPWEKKNALPNRQYMMNCEFALYLFKGKAKTIARPGDKQLIKGAIAAGKIHPTQKPVWLMGHYITNSCDTKGMVLDPFAGSGSTLVAAMLSGRRAIGVEVNPEYFEAACARLERVHSGRASHEDRF